MAKPPGRDRPDRSPSPHSFPWSTGRTSRSSQAASRWSAPARCARPTQNLRRRHLFPKGDKCGSAANEPVIHPHPLRPQPSLSGGRSRRFTRRDTRSGRSAQGLIGSVTRAAARRRLEGRDVTQAVTGAHRPSHAGAAGRLRVSPSLATSYVGRIECWPQPREPSTKAGARPAKVRQLDRMR